MANAIGETGDKVSTAFGPTRLGDKMMVDVANKASLSSHADAETAQAQRVLVVEDEAALLDVLTQLLAHAGLDVRGAEDGAAGLAAFEAAAAEGQPFDLVILDVMMPKMNGFELCESIRRESDVPIMVLTALSAEDDQLKAFSLLADDYVTKPFSLPVVVERVRALLRRSRGRGVAGVYGAASESAAVQKSETPETVAHESAAVLRNGPLSIDLESRTVARDGRVASLTRTEFDVLAALYERPGRVLTREALVERTQGFSWSGNDAAMKLHVMNIRRKLGDDVIETVRGVGYRAPRRLA